MARKKLDEKIKWHIECVKLSDIIPYEKNPRKIGGKKLEDLKKSIEKFGLAEPYVLNTNRVLIGGHARMLVEKSEGVTESDCYVPDRELTEEEHAELVIRLNKNVAGEWDFDCLANEFDIGDLKDWGFEDADLGIAPAFAPVSADEQGKLDEKKKVTCPNCDHEFTP